MGSTTVREQAPGFFGLEALLPGDDSQYHTIITDDNGNTVAEGWGNAAEEAQQNASGNLQ